MVEEELGSIVGPDLGVAVAADDEGEVRGVVEGEAEVGAVDGESRAGAAEVRGDGVVALGDLGADDAPILGDGAVLAAA
jgi:hypothetical protein